MILRELPIIDVDGKKKRIALYPKQIVFIEEMTPKQCNIVVRIVGRDLTYLCPKSFSYIQNFSNLGDFNLFIPN